jgi:predicted metal-dependent peptidase
MVVGKTYKDVRDFDVKRHKEIAREFTKDLDMRTRAKPLVKNEKRRGPKNLVRELDSLLEDEYDDKYEGEQHEIN